MVRRDLVLLLPLPSSPLPGFARRPYRAHLAAWLAGDADGGAQAHQRLIALPSGSPARWQDCLSPLPDSLSVFAQAWPRSLGPGGLTFPVSGFPFPAFTEHPREPSRDIGIDRRYSLFIGKAGDRARGIGSHARQGA